MIEVEGADIENTLMLVWQNARPTKLKCGCFVIQCALTNVPRQRSVGPNGQIDALCGDELQ